MKLAIKTSFLTVFSLLFSLSASSQNVGINGTGATPDASAMLDIASTTSGLLAPRMTTAQRTAIATPANGLLVFDMTTESFWFYNGVTPAWEELTGGGAAANDTLPLIIDANRDTWVHVEQNPNEDIIRFVTDTNERWRMEGDVFYPTSGSTLIGSVARDITFETSSSKTILIGERGTVFGTSNRIMNNSIGIGDAVFNTSSGGQTFRRCIAIGPQAGSTLGPPGAVNSIMDNIAIGENSLYHQAPSTGSSIGNVGVGKLTLGSLLSGEYNVALGHGAGNVRFGTGNVFLGRNTGIGTAFDYDDLLFIDNKLSARPLIWGDMANDSVTIHGTLSVGSEAAGIIYTLPNTDGIPNQVLQTDGSGDVSWTTVAGLDTLSIIADDDRDTWIQTEQNTDEDIIRFVLDTNEQWRMIDRRLEPSDPRGHVFIGQNVANNQAPGFPSIPPSAYVGHRAALSTTTGLANVALGSYALLSNTGGHYNVALGSWAAGGVNGLNNIGIGFESLADAKPGTNENIAIGSQALKSTLGSRNIALGYQAGDNAAFVNTSDQLIIENSNSATPLIWGDFANDSLTVHGTLSVADPATGNNHYSFPNAAGTNGQVLQTDGAGNADWASLSLIQDADRDTRIEVESSPDADSILFTILGTSRWQMIGDRLEPTNINKRLLIGSGTGEALVGGTSAAPVLIGNDAAVAELYGLNTTVIGHSAMRSTTGSQGNTVVGSDAMTAATSGDGNTLVGAAVMSNATTSGGQNVAIGFVAMQSATGAQNIAVGTDALSRNFNGSRNVAIGHESGNNSTGSDNVFLGTRSGQTETGDNKLYIANSATQNPLIWGDFANDSLTVHGTLTVADPGTGANYYSFPNATGTNGQVLQTDGAGNATWANAGSADTLSLIQDADRDTKVWVDSNSLDYDQIVFEMADTEYLRLINGRFQTSNDLQSVRIGNRAGESLTGVHNVLIGEIAGASMTTGAGNLGIGSRSLDSATAVFNNVALGLNTMRSLKTGGRNVAIGAFALQNIDNSANYNTAVGAEAGGEATGWRNVFIGYAAGYNATGGDKLFIANSITNNPLVWGDFANDSLTAHGTFSVANPITGVNYFHMNNGRMHVVNTGLSVFIGDQAGANDDLSTNQNVFIGDNAGLSNTTGDRNVYIGSQTGSSNITGGRNVAIGRSAMLQATGSGNIMLGDLAGQRTAGAFNIGIGVNAAINRVNGSANISMGVNASRDATSGDNNIAIGASAMLFNIDGSNNVVVGNGAFSAGTNSTGNVAIGNQAGANETGDSTLYISNSNTANPLIYGEFNNNILRANGTFQISNPATTGYAFPAATGTTGQFLELDVSGDLVWANSTANTDNQQTDVFQLNGNNLELSLQNDGVATQTVDLSGYLDADNLGDHTATQNIQTNGNWVSNDGGNEGVYVHTDGSVAMSTVPSFSAAIVDVLNPIQSTINTFVEVGGATGTTLLSGGWTTTKDTYNHNDGGHFNTTTGRFMAPYDGLYFFSAHVRVDGINAPVAPATLSFSRLVLAVNGDFVNQIDGAMHSIVDHNAGTGDWTMHSISGVMKLTAGQYVSLGVVSHSDDSWRIIGESGFSGYMITRQ